MYMITLYPYMHPLYDIADIHYIIWIMIIHTYPYMDPSWECPQADSEFALETLFPGFGHELSWHLMGPTIWTMNNMWVTEKNMFFRI